MRLRWQDFNGGLWVVGPSEDGPQSTLRRAKGVAPLRSRALRSRSGTLTYFSQNTHSMTRYNSEYVLGVGTSLYVSASRAIASETQVSGSAVFDGTPLTFVQMPPTSKALLDGAGVQDYLFIAGGGDLKKLNPALDTVTEWGIAPPDVSSATATADSQTTNHADDLDDIADGTAWSDPDSGANYTLQNDTARFLEGSGSMRFQGITKDSSAQAIRTSITQDWSDLGTGAGSSVLADFVTFAVRIQRPKHVKSISITFDVDTAGGLNDFAGKTFSRELRIQTVRKRRRRKLVGTGDIIRRKDEQKFLQDKAQLPRDFSTQEFLAEDTIGVSRRRWTRVTIPKATFDANGGADPDTDWATVRGIRFEVETNRQGGTNVNIDNLALAGGFGMQGDYQYNVTYLNSTTGTRSNPDLTNTITVKDIERQSVTLASIPASTDTQVDKVEIWRTIGNGEIFFKEQEVANTDAGGGVLANVTSSAADYIGMYEGASVTLDPDLTLPLDNIKPDVTYEDAVGPYVGRMWWTRDTATGSRGRVYYSPIGRAEAVKGFIDIASEEAETQKLVIWNQQLYCFTKSHLYRVDGSDEPFTFTEVWGAPGTAQPFSVVPTPEGIFYFALDGVRVFDGNASRVVGAGDPLAPIFRNSAVSNLPAFAGSNAAYGRGEYYVTDSTDSTKTTLAVDASTGAWRDLGFPSNFLFYDDKSNILFGQNVPSAFGAVLHTRLTTAASSFSVANTSQYVMLGACSTAAVGKATIGDAQFLAPKGFTITAIYVITPSNGLTAGQTVDFQINVNGTADSSLSAQFSNGSGTSASATGGSIAIAQDDLVCIEAIFVGATSFSVGGLTVAYEITAGAT